MVLIFRYVFIFIQSAYMNTIKEKKNKVATKNLKYKLCCMFQTRKNSSPVVRRRKVSNLLLENPCTTLNV